MQSKVTMFNEIWDPTKITQLSFAMKIFRKHILLCALIILLSGNAAGEFSPHRDVFAQKAYLSRDDESVDYRLPKSVRPISYEIMFMPKLQNFKFEGIEKIVAVVEQETDTITLHVGNIQINSQSVIINQTNIYESMNYDKVTEKHTIILSETLKKGSEILITFSFHGNLRDDMIGFYKSSYFDEDGQIKWLATTQFQATHARHAFPCFDEPSFKAIFTIRILRDESYTSLSNMPLAEINEPKNGVVWDNFNQTIPMSTFLVAFVISEFHHLEQGQFKVWARPNAINQAHYALKIGTTVLELLGDAFGQNYQLPKMDMIAIPDFAAGAMENWGLVTYREVQMLYVEEESSVIAQQIVASAIVHELSHMWFGNLVTPEWWGYLWLSEAFAKYFQYFVTADVEVSWNMKEQFVVDEHQAALIADSFESSQPMTRKVSSQSQIGGMGDTITYSKGASIVRMMNFIFGNNAFKSALRDYLSKNKGTGLGNPDALWTVLQTQVNRNGASKRTSVKTIMDTWTTKAGYPVVSVAINDEGVLHVTQERFFLRNLNKTSTDITWWVPLTWTSQSKSNFDNTTTKYWLSTKEDTLDLQVDPKEWVIFNVQSSGFYRVNYNHDGWQRIFDVLHSDKFTDIHVLNRAALVDDLLNLGRAGYQDYATVLEGITYLKRETNYLAFRAGLNGLSYLSKRFSGYEEHSLFKQYVLSLINDRREQLGYEDRAGDDRLTVLLRRDLNIWACNFNDVECVTTYTNKFQKWKANRSIPIKPNERTAAYCVGIRNGTSEDWEFLWKQYFNSNYASKQIEIINALGCSLNTTILEKYLKYAISDYQINRIRKQDSTSVFAAVYSSLIGAEYILDFVDKHYKEMEEYYGGLSTVAMILDGASQRFSTRRLVDKFEDFVNRHKTEFAPILESLLASLRVARYELEWYKTASVPIIRWIQDDLKKDVTTKPTITTTTTTTMTTTTTTTPPSEDIAKYRLPAKIIPYNYIITLTPKLKDEKFTFDGNVEINVDVVEQTDLIVLHSVVLELHSVIVKDQDDIIVESYQTVEKYDFLEIKLVRRVDAGTKLTIEIAYKSALASDLRGFYKSSYVNNDGSLSWLAATQLEPVHARKMFPCFDEPALKATFTIKVCTEKEVYAISNMKVSEIKHNCSSDYPSGTVFSESVKMSTYLVALVVSNFKSTKKVEDKFAVYARPNAIDQAEYALSVISPLVKFFEKNLNQNYQINKLDMVALPDFEMGAMENWGLLTYREARLLYHKDHSSITSKQAIRNVIAHEIAHQWFGNLVSPSWWKYVWLSEGFGRYFQYHATAIVFNDTTMDSQFVVDQVHSAFVADSSSSTHPMSHDVYTPDEIQNIFDTISYAKAASVLRMIEKSFGQEVFYNALRDYLNKQKYSVSIPQDLYEQIQKQIDLKGRKENIQEILDTWTTQPGYPVVHVDIQDEVITFKQERFFLKTKEGYYDDNIWHIPITIVTFFTPDYKNTTPRAWFTEKEMEIKSPDSFFDSKVLIINVQQSGFYRVNYNEDHWLLLIAILQYTSNNIIDEINCAALIDDVMNLARANYVNYKIAISATQYLTRERNYAPWRAFYNNLPYLNRRFRGRDMDTLYKKYLVSLINPLYNELGFMDKGDDEINLVRTKNMLRMYTREWACELDIADCRFQAMRYFQQKRYYLQEIPPNYRGVVYCTAMESDGTSFTYNFLQMEYKKSNVMADKLVILSSMTCSQNKDILEKLLLTAIEEHSLIRLQDSTKVFSDVYDAGLIGVEVVMNVIMNDTNYNNMNKRFGYAGIKNIVSALASRLSTYELYGKYRELLDWLVNKEPTFENVVGLYVADAEYEFDWYERQAPEIFEVLDKLLQGYTYRLPNTLYPEQYNITLAPYIEEGIFEGNVQIDIRVEKNTSAIFLNSYNLDIKHMNVSRINSKDDSKDEEIPISNYTLNPYTQQLKIYLTEFINAEKIKVNIEFNGTFNDKMQGFYRSSYLDKSGTLRWLATTQFQPVHAREAFPCFDEPAFKSKFLIKIQRPTLYNTLSNMPLSESIPSEKVNYTWDIFQTSTVKMPTYLVAFIVSEFKSLKEPADSINIWGRKEIVESGYLARNAAVVHLRTLENFTGIEYPLTKLDLVGIPDYASGAMENWGLITFSERALFYEENITTSKYEKDIISTIAHELVHTWFGNLVTCQWWDYIWLNEGFAEYLEWYATAQLLPEDQLMDQFVVYELQEALAKDLTDSAHPMTNPVKTPEEIKDIFDYVSYGKSSCVLRMLFNAFDEEVHKSALHNYLTTQQKVGTARPEDLWKSFEPYVSISSGIIKLNIKEVMDTWTNQAGYPVVHASLDDSLLTLTQGRFFLNKETRWIHRNSTEFYWIPIHITTSLIETLSTDASYDIKTDVWLGPEPMQLYINPVNEWVIVNYKQTGFYRVNYDDYSWLRLIGELQGIRYWTINVVNRAQIMDDLYYLARAGYVNQELWWKATKYLIQETEHLPWKTFINSMSYVYERFEGRDYEDVLKKYILKLMSKTYDQVGFNDLGSDKLMDRLHREMILQWACKLGKPQCVEKSISLFASWKDGKGSIPTHAQAAVYCTALRNGISDDWDFLWNKYLKTNLASEKLVIINALGCSRNQTVLYNYLMKVIKDNKYNIVIRKQDASAVFASVYGASQLGINVTLDFLINNLEEIHDYFGNWDDVRQLAANAASHISNILVYNKLSLLYETNREVFPTRLTRPVYKNVDDNLNWYFTNGKEFGYWISVELHENNSNTGGGCAVIEPLNIALITLVALISYVLNCY
ncbi:putative aminopeptidase-2 [Odontomachus brunneus]|uniref:putative aminopeptidase-2 n=1 Tax=Odontomachus brunneus TaxID=486640 RepID=UPI0013F2B28F|nr:putative aminopeptidase-2 [Odontomachus brunneus]